MSSEMEEMRCCFALIKTELFSAIFSFQFIQMDLCSVDWDVV